MSLTDKIAIWSMVGTWVAAIAAVVALVFAKRTLNAWKEEKIEVAKAKWIAALVDYASNISFLPDTIYWDDPNDNVHLERVAALMYECIKRWKVFQTYLELSEKKKSQYEELYSEKWGRFSLEYHNGYMEKKISKTDVKEYCVSLYNT
ncbi:MULTISPECIES: hypothetical protein [Citrobacter freundii complex]|uniref:hypothetical protein n=1 Tax=Citrobacter freundii complex TaxID=1344959 RepID=UPI0006507C2F|nr:MULTISPECIES: hypothetical protein [Citrobacter freundii complex]EKV0155557.1 hypothetical protein [Citrobacter freundii]KLV54617.1 hypothetical protein SK34_03328 [Citrobacter sp. MGH104]MBJ9132697.1 hypothetical protein [Citrobacter freundii]DAP49740.1 MAG TPA: hypothetical protein [Caudoviricetes sp.]